MENKPIKKSKPGFVKRSGPGGFKGRSGRPFRKKVCKFCAEHAEIDYKNVWMLKNYISLKGKILSSRFTGVCIKHQRSLTRAIKRARNIALIPFASM